MTPNRISDDRNHLDAIDINYSFNLNQQCTLDTPLSWSPDRLLVHIIHDSLADSGESGLSLQVMFKTPRKFATNGFPEYQEANNRCLL